MRTRRVTVSKGRPDELGDDGSGYAANGESRYSRASANPEVGSHGFAKGAGLAIGELKQRLHRARVRASHHADPLVRKRAGEDARDLERSLKRIGVDTSGQHQTRVRFHLKSDDSLEGRIRYQESEIGRLESRLRFVTDQAIREKLTKDIDIKTRFLNRLRAERKAEADNG